MKKNFIYLITSIMILSLISCSDDDSDSISSRAEISVFENGSTQSGVTVHMFRANQGPNSNFFKPIYSRRSVITDSNGKATFNLRETFDLEIIDSQTTLYFGVFDENDNPIGNTGITIEKNETKNATINIE